MAEKGTIERRIAAIMFVDMVGYSAVAHRDAARAQTLLTDFRQLVRAALERGQGREIQTIGDGFLVEFDGAMAALNCARAIQKTIHARNQSLPADQRFLVRIGVHQGEVMREGGDILGNGVNIAARVEPLAAPGGITFTQAARDEFPDPAALGAVAMGPTRLKNIPTPVPLYQVPPIGAGPEWQPQAARPPGGLPRALPLTALAAAAIVGALFFWGFSRPLAAPGHQHVVVLPFHSVSPGGTNQALSEGFSETLAARLTELQARRPQLCVVPMSEVLGGRITTVAAARGAFGATHALVGSVERRGQQVRLHLALVDARSQSQLRACTTNGIAANLFPLEDALAAEAAKWLGLPPRAPQPGVRPPERPLPAAYEPYLIAVGKLARYDVTENIDAALEYFQQALLLDDKFAAAQAGLAEAYWRKHELRRQPEFMTQSRRCAKRALELNPRLARAYVVLANLALDGGDTAAEGVTLLERALELDPYDSLAWSSLALAAARVNQPEQLQTAVQRALDHNPQHWATYNCLGKAYFEQGKMPQAAAAFRSAITLAPDSHVVYFNLGGTHIAMGRYAEAEAALRTSLSLRETPEALSNLGTAFYYQHKFVEAMNAYQKATAAGGAAHDWWGNLGDACRWVPGAEQRGRDAYTRAAGLARRDLVARSQDAVERSYLAWYLTALRRPAEARTNLVEALALAPRSGEVLFNAALVYEVQGARSNALACLERARVNGFPAAVINHHVELDRLRQEEHYCAP